jgi:hypothetical protein
MKLLLPITSLVILTLLSGLLDARGFIHASRIWQDGRFVKVEVIQSSLFFFGGITFYLASIRYLQRIGIVLPEIQTVFWFAVTLIGVAVINGKFLLWGTVDRIVAVIVVLGIGWLILRTGE